MGFTTAKTEAAYQKFLKENPDVQERFDMILRESFIKGAMFGMADLSESISEEQERRRREA